MLRPLSCAAVLLLAVACDRGPTEPVLGDPAEIRISEHPDTLVLNDSLQLTASLMDADGNVLPDSGLVWSSSDPRMLEVRDGLVVVKDWWQTPTITITASYGEISGSTDLVVFPIVDRVIPNFGSRMVTGLEKELKVDLMTTTPGYGRIPLRLEDHPVAWKSSDPSVLQIAEDGRMHALGPGTVRVSASYHGGTYERDVTVQSGGYEVDPIEVPGAVVTRITALNGRGDLGIIAEEGGAERGYIRIGGLLHDLGDIHPRGISDDGLVVVASKAVSGNRQRAVVWRNGVVEDLVPEHPDWSTLAGPMTPDGRVIVRCSWNCGTNAGIGLLWEDGEGIEELFPPGTLYPSNVNDDLVIAGTMSPSPGSWSAVSWSATGGFRTYFTSRRDAGAPALSSSGEVIAYTTQYPWPANPINSLSYRFIGDDRTPIPGLGSSTRAQDINDHGVVVGTTLGLQKETVGFLEAEDVTVVLDDVVADGWTLTEALSINNAGQIVASGSRDGGTDQFLLLTPRP